MQNQGPPYQGSINQGSFPEHTYSNQMAAHCPPSGYQAYVNGPYPVGNPRAHHYGNHQMQQGPPPNQIPYRGSYAPPIPPPSQYGPPPPSQDMYRTPHPVYMGGNNRSFHGKSMWVDNNSADMMPSYNHGPSHPQMMNNSGPMNVSSMRSPPHLASSVNPVPSPGSQHYRQMQSPGHSPQTWPQVQVPSPGMHPVARTTPSPLQAHARSPGHSQPFSPSAATHMSSSVNMPSHPIPSVVPENPQSAQTVNQGMGNVITPGPLHSLQKMVMLEQDTNPMQMNCELSNDNNCDQLSVCSSNSAAHSEHNPQEDMKDSSFATYYNLDENRLESQPHATASFKPPDFSLNNSVSEVSCSPQALIANNSEASSEANDVSDEPVKPKDTSFSALNATDAPVKETISCSLSSPPDIPNGLSKCLPDATSLKSVQEPKSPLKDEKPEGVDANSNSNDEDLSATAQNSSPNSHEAISCSTSDGEILPTVPSKLHEGENSEEAESLQSNKAVHSDICDEKSNESVDETSSNEVVENSSLLVAGDQEQKSLVAFTNENTETTCISEGSEKLTESSPSTEKKQESKSESVPVQNVPETRENSPAEDDENARNTEAQSPKAVSATNNGKSKSVAVNSRTLHKTSSSCKLSDSTVVTTESSLTSNGSSMVNIGKTRISASDIARNPVKVVIHRIRTNSTNDTWHVPKSSGNPVVDKDGTQKLSGDSGKTDTSQRASKIGPQIIILSPAMSRKKFGIPTTGNPKSIVTVKKENTDNGSNPSGANPLPASVSPKKRKKIVKPSGMSQNSSEKETVSIVGKKRGRPCGSPNKVKRTSGSVASPTKKKRRGRQKNTKKRKPEINEVELPPKPKKLKPFAGPYVHVTGPKSSPSSITVINVALKEEEKGKILRTKTADSSVVKRPRVGHTSTLSPHYDAFNKDRTWLCVFCHRGSHSNGLGDLYGPYYIKDDGIPLIPTSDSTASPCSNRGNRSKRRRSDASVTECTKTPSPKKGSKQASKPPEQSEVSEGNQNASTGETPAQSDEVPSKEVWIHEDCAVWCQGVSLMGSQIHGLEEAIQEARENTCSHCKLTGATVGCWSKGCKEQFHFCCAKEKGCKLDIEKFSLLCSKHKDVKCVEKQDRTL